MLADGGTSEGDRVAYLGLNSLSFLVTMLAAFRLGAIFVPVNFRLAGPELESVLARSGANTIVCEEGHRAAVDAVTGHRSLSGCSSTTIPRSRRTPVTRPWIGWSALFGRRDAVR